MEEIVRRLKDLRQLGKLPETEEEVNSRDVHNYYCNHAGYVIRSGEKLCGDDRAFVIAHPEVFLTDDDKFLIMETNNLKFEVFVDKKMKARFFNMRDASEYVMFLKELI